MDQEIVPLEESVGYRSVAEMPNDEMLQSRSHFNYNSRSGPVKWDRNSKMPATMMKRWFGGDAKKDAEVMLLFK